MCSMWPSCVFTNDRTPPNIPRAAPGYKRTAVRGGRVYWRQRHHRLRPYRVKGRWALIGAGAVVACNVPVMR